MIVRRWDKKEERLVKVSEEEVSESVSVCSVCLLGWWYIICAYSGVKLSCLGILCYLKPAFWSWRGLHPKNSISAFVEYIHDIYKAHAKHVGKKSCFSIYGDLMCAIFLLFTLERKPNNVRYPKNNTSHSVYPPLICGMNRYLSLMENASSQALLELFLQWLCCNLGLC